jgi:hypothetical protein
MQSVSFPARQARSHYRHELRTLTYVTLDQANGGIIRNLNREGVAVQAVARLREEQRVRLRFELRFPRLRVEASGQVSWAGPTGQCGIRFVDLPAETSRQIDEWIFANLLDALARDAARPHSIFGASVVSIARERSTREVDDGLILSPIESPVIRLEPMPVAEKLADLQHGADTAYLFESPEGQAAWLSQPLSGRTLAWLADGLVVTAAVLLFALVFLSIAHELPPWPLTLAGTAAAVVFIAAMYRTVFAVFGGPSFGARLARVSESSEKEEDVEEARIR